MFQIIKQWLQKVLVEDYLKEHYIGRTIDGMAKDAVRYHLEDQRKDFEDILLNQIAEIFEEKIKKFQGKKVTKKKE